MTSSQKTKILSVATSIPEFTKTTDEIIKDMEKHLEGQDERFKRKVLRIFKYAQVDRRYSIMPAEAVLAHTTLQERNDYYIEKVTDLAEDALRKALQKAKLSPKDIDYIITVSCTGFMIPSVDAYLINRLQMRQDIVRLPVTEMGCAAGVSGLIYANNFLKAHPEKRAAVIAVESPMSTFQYTDFSMANMVSAALFGDGAACAIVGAGNQLAPAIVDSNMYHFFDQTRLMGFDLKNTGFTMVLDPSVPETIREHFEHIIFPFLQKNQLDIQDIKHLIFHPGGKKIIQMVEELFGALGKNLDQTKEVLRNYGNMSSATVLYVMKAFMEKEIDREEYGLMLSFGPGFSAQSLLLQWQE